MSEDSAPRDAAAGDAPRGRRDRHHPDRPCRNCGDPTPGLYCRRCGQKKVDHAASVRAMLADALEDYVVLDRKLPRTLWALVAKPGQLTREFVRGRVARYIRPFRLYITSSVLFFLLFSFFSLRALGEADVDFPGSGDARVDTAGAAAAAVIDLDSVLAELPPARRAAVQRALEEAALEAVRDSLTDSPAETATGTPPQAGRAAGRDTAGAGGPTPVVGISASSSDSLGVRVNTLNATLDSLIERNIRELVALGPQQAIQTVARDYLEYVPTMVFLLMPVFALILKLLYLRRRRYYAEHFVFALHVHAFAFLLFTAMLLTGQSAAIGFLALWLLAYTFIAMKRVYGQSTGMTLVKFSAFGLAYFLVFTLAASVTLVVTLALL